VSINGETHSLWRAVDHEGEVLESFVTRRRDCKAELKVLKTSTKRHGRPHTLVTDKLRSYGAAMKVVGKANRQETGRWENNRAENAHPLPDSGLLAKHKKGPFRRRARAMQRFRSMQCLQKFAAVHASVYNHFNQERAFYAGDKFKANRAAALAEWHQICSLSGPAFGGELRPVLIRLRAPNCAYRSRLT
jgi:putative transposase